MVGTGRVPARAVVSGDTVRPGDPELVAAVAAGDQLAFAALYDRHVNVVYGVVGRFLRERASAEEIVQESFLALWQRAGQYDPGSGSVLGWLLGIARHRSIDRLRAAARRPRTISEWGTAPGDPDGPGEWTPAEQARDGGNIASTDPGTIVERRWASAVVRTALSAIPESERRIVELAYDDGLSQREIAERLGIPLGTVKSRTRRALAVLREALDGVPELHEGPTSAPSPRGQEAS
jgi:RNA polymerase sigma-70 factor (ECF subfamily)